MFKFFAAAAAVLAVATFASAASDFSYKLRVTGKGWPACAPTSMQESGYLDINSTTNKHYFYWMVGPKNNKPSNKLIIWLTGGPGCSSTLALLAENGPCHIHESGPNNGQLYENPHSWSNDAYVIWVDQPAGVGYSYSDAKGHDHDEKQVGRDMHAFVQALLKEHPSMQSHELTVVGESYGGHYAPASAYAIFEGNNNMKPGDIKVNLVALATGNGLTAPVIQYKYYAEMAWDGCKEVIGKPCVSQYTYDSMNASIPGCVKMCKSCDNGDQLACDIGRDTCNGGEILPYMMTGRNPYNVKLMCGSNPLCYDFSAATTFLNRADVKASLGADANIQWQTCNMQVNMQFAGDWLHRFDLLIPPMLEKGIRFMQYSGANDFICNNIGNKAWTLALPWSGQNRFDKAADQKWEVNGTYAGTARFISGPNTPIQMAFLKVYDAGHMVPMDQPAFALDLITKFINNKPFVN